MKVRNLRKTDNLEIVTKVFLESFVETYKDYVPKENLNRIVEEVLQNSVEDHSDFFVMLDQTDIVGTASIGEGIEESGEIVSIYLSHDYVDQGYGRLLLLAMVDELYERGYEKAYLWDIEENERAKAFYLKHKFKVLDQTRVVDFGGKELKQVKYEMKINPEFMIR